MEAPGQVEASTDLPPKRRASLIVLSGTKRSIPPPSSLRELSRALGVNGQFDSKSVTINVGVKIEGSQRLGHGQRCGKRL